MRLDGRVIVVTGASSGLGKAMANGFVAEGALVACASRGEDRLERAVAGLDGPGEAIAVPADVRSWESVRSLIETARDRLGPIDVLVNNAGINSVHVTDEWRPVHEVAVEVWDAVVETNLRGAFLCARAVLPGLLDRGRGRLIHVSSGHGVAGRARRTPYVASKFGLEGLHESLALELEGTGVSSVTLRPPAGGVYTEIAGERGRSRESFRHPDAEVVAEPAVKLAAGEGDNGGRYVATDDGAEFRSYARADPER